MNSRILQPPLPYRKSGSQDAGVASENTGTVACSSTFSFPVSGRFYDACTSKDGSLPPLGRPGANCPGIRTGKHYAAASPALAAARRSRILYATILPSPVNQWRLAGLYCSSPHEADSLYRSIALLRHYLCTAIFPVSSDAWNVTQYLLTTAAILIM